MFMKDFILDDTDAPSDMSIHGEHSHNVSQDKHLNESHCGKKTKKITINIDRDLLKFKAFFFLFFAGFGATFPYLGVYFKQIGLSATFVGVLAGIRPLIQFISGPFWALLADRYKARKAILLFSILAWLVMTLLLAFPRPHNEVCKITNVTHHAVNIISSHSHEQAQQKSVIPAACFQGRFGEFLYTEDCINCKDRIREAPSFEDLRIRRSNQTLSHDLAKGNKSLILNIQVENNNTAMYTREKVARRDNASFKREKTEEHTTTVQRNSYQLKYIIERDQNEIRDIFYVLLVLIVVGEFLEAPSFIMIDTALLEHLGDNKKHYGKTRLFGSIGYGLASFTVGAILDRFEYEFCGKIFTNYMVLFYLFAVFMVIGFVFGLFCVDFRYSDAKEASKPVECLKLFVSVKYGSFLCICWFCGFCHGSIMNFLNWYLEDLGATKLMMGVATACRCSAIIFGFFTSSYFIERVGHIQLICWAVASYVASFFGYASLTNPWLAIPIEVVQGLIYAISWSSCITYLGEAAPPNTAATMQGILQGVYWGLGTGTGAICGGVMINHLGVRLSFKLGGVVSTVVFLLYCCLQIVISQRDKRDKK